MLPMREKRDRRIRSHNTITAYPSDMCTARFELIILDRNQTNIRTYTDTSLQPSIVNLHKEMPGCKLPNLVNLPPFSLLIFGENALEERAFVQFYRSDSVF